MLDAIAELPPVPGRRTTRDQWHITLQFLGDIPNLDDVALDLETASAVVQFGGLGTFPGVIWLGLAKGGDTLSALADEVGTQLGIEEQRKYHPHLTLARVKKRIKPRDLPDVGAVGGEWKFDEVVLYESELHHEGARYTTRAKFPLP